MTKNGKIALFSVAIAVSMLGMAYAAVPLYNLFCAVTGYGGTTGRASSSPDQALEKTIAIRFDSNTDPGLPWNFKQQQDVLSVRIGQQMMAHYTAENLTDRPISGQAIYNVTPEIAGSYFKKIDCFCFNKQTLNPHEKVHMPVIFFVDPAIERDPEARKIKEITLSYTFFPFSG